MKRSICYSFLFRPAVWVGLLAVAAAASGQVGGNADGEQAEPFELDPFEVRAQEDFGYRKVNAITATRLGASIHETPLTISVIGEEFIEDLAITAVNDLFDYTASVRASYDVPVGIAEGTSDGGIQIRGFVTQVAYQDGLRRDVGFHPDGVDRIEVIRGPVGLYFGRTEPAGIVNFISKRPHFLKRTKVQATVGNDSFYKGLIDHQDVFFDDKFAVRGVFSYRDSDSWQQYTEWDEQYGLVSLAYQPVRNLKLTLQFEDFTLDKTGGRVNALITNREYFAGRADGTLPVGEDGLMETRREWRTRIFNETGRDPRRFNMFSFPRGFSFNQNGPGSFDDLESQNYVLDAKWTISEGLYFRGSYAYSSSEQLGWWPIAQAVPQDPGALVALYSVDGDPNSPYVYNTAPLLSASFNPFWANAPGKFSADDDWQNLQIDLGYDFEAFSASHSLVASVEWIENIARRFGQPTDREQMVLLGGIPGGFSGLGDDPVSAEANAILVQKHKRLEDLGLIGADEPFSGTAVGWLGLDLSDPNFEYPNLRSLIGPKTEDSTGGSDSIERGASVKYRGTFGRFTAVLGTRWTDFREIDADFIGGEHSRNGEWASWSEITSTIGGVYEVSDDVNAFVSFSETFIPTGRAVNDLVVNQETGERVGGNILDAPTGEGTEAGLKFRLGDYKLTGTASVFRLDRTGLIVTDVVLTDRLIDENVAAVDRGEDPIWYNETDGNFPLAGGNRPGIRVNSGLERVEGIDLEFIYTPFANLQIVSGLSHYFTRDYLIKDPTHVNVNRGGLFNGLNGLNDGRDARPDLLANVPEWMLSSWFKYTFNEGVLDNLGVGFGFEYQSEELHNEFPGADPEWSWGSWVRYDAMLTYLFELEDGDLRLQLNLRNLTDEEIVTGTFGLNPLREWRLSATYTF